MFDAVLIPNIKGSLMKTMKGIIITAFLFCSVSTFAQWAVIDTFFTYNNTYNSYFNIYVRIINDGVIAYTFLCDPPSPSSPGTLRVYKTTDDCISWQYIYGDYGYGLGIYDLQFPHPDTGFISYNLNSHVCIDRTTDGGGSWEFITGFGPEKMFFISGMKGYGTDGPIFKRYENYAFFDVDTLSFTLKRQKIYFTKNNIGYRIYSLSNSQPRRYLMKTLDDGENWEVVFNNDTRYFNDVIAPSDSICYLACDSGIIYKSTDIGETWSIINLNTNTSVRSISFINNFTGYALCTNNIVYATFDGGNTWLSQTLPSNIDIAYSIKMINENVGYINAIAPQTSEYIQCILLKTENGGFTSIADKEENQNTLKIYPNPIANSLNIEMKPEYKKIDICDIKGLTVYSRDLNQSNIQTLKVELSNLNSGIYLLKIKSKENIFTKKLIKL